MNVVVVLTDQHNVGFLGCAGTPHPDPDSRRSRGAWNPFRLRLRDLAVLCTITRKHDYGTLCP